MNTWRQAAAAGLLNAAYELLRTACELACKALLELHTGSFPKTHDPSAALHRADLVPAGVPLVRLRTLLASYTRGVYGTSAPATRAECREAARFADRLLDAFDAANP